MNLRVMIALIDPRGMP